eukprot:3179251-Amphidinium_carterae.1
MGSGPQKNHRTVHPDDQMTHCLHVDLAGPFDSSDCPIFLYCSMLNYWRREAKEFWSFAALYAGQS